MASDNIDKVIGALNDKVLDGTKQAIKIAATEVANVTTDVMKGMIKGKRPYVGKGKNKRYAKGNPPEPPKNRTGHLRRNIKFDVKEGFEGTYVATVAPYSIYARALEFGHPRWKAGTRYPFVEPTAKIMSTNNRAREIYLKALRAELSK